MHDWKARLGCDAGEGVGRSQSVIVVRDDLRVLEIFANQFESKAETADKICGLAQKWQIGVWMIGCGHPLSGTKEMWMAPFVPQRYLRHSKVTVAIRGLELRRPCPNLRFLVLGVRPI